MRTVSPSLTIELPWPSDAERGHQEPENNRSVVNEEHLAVWKEQLARALHLHGEVLRQWPAPISVSFLAISPIDWSSTDVERITESLLATLQAGLQLEASAFQTGYQQMLTGGEPGIAVIIGREGESRSTISGTCMVDQEGADGEH